MRNWPRYSRGSLDAEEITRPLRKKIFFSTFLLLMTSVPVFCPRLSHWSRSPGSIVCKLPLRAITERRAIISAATSAKTKTAGRSPPLSEIVVRNRDLRSDCAPAGLRYLHFDRARGLIARIIDRLHSDRVLAILAAG